MAQGRCVDVVRATQDEIVEALLNYESYPQWQALVLDTTVLSRDEQGRGTLLELRVDAKVRKVSVVVGISYEDDSIHCRLVRGDVKDYKARYRFAPRADGTTSVTYEISVEAGFPMPGPLKKLLAEKAVRDTMDSLKKRVEA